MRQFELKATLAALTLLGTAACGPRHHPAPADQKSPGERLPGRHPAGAAWPSVGLMTAFDQCSGVIVRHGLFLTAKHCVAWTRGVAKPDLRLSFPAKGTEGAERDEIHVEKEAISAVELVDGHDLAIIRYDAAVTEKKVPLAVEKVADDRPPVGATLLLISYPSNRTAEPIRVVSPPCHTKNLFGPMSGALASTYEGSLLGTDCIAWWGSSGAPVFLADADHPDQPLELLGVVSHSFDVDEKGNPLPGILGSDQFGEYAESSNIAPAWLIKERL